MRSSLILMRHGQSAWNEQNLFTGWVDIPLSEKGIEESRQGGRHLKDIPLDAVYTSTLVRAHMTLAIALLHHSSGKVPVFLHPAASQQGQWSRTHGAAKTLPVTTAWELNERMYGDLQGLNKRETAEKYGAAQVQQWRRSFDVAPPGGESLAQTAARAIPYFTAEILPHIMEGKNILIVAHGNSLRSIVMHLEQLTPEEVVALELATGEPRTYLYESGQWHRN